jgi:hypothetical protein
MVRNIIPLFERGGCEADGVCLWIAISEGDRKRVPLTKRGLRGIIDKVRRFLSGCDGKKLSVIMQSINAD